MYRDTDFDPNAEERLREQEREEELARRIRREVMRVQSGEADREIEADRERDEAERNLREQAERRAKRRQGGLLWGMVTGSVIGREWLARHYRYPLLIAGIFFMSILVMFWALRLDMRYTRLEREVQLLRERSVRLEEQRYRLTTHSAVVEQLRARGIPLQDPLTPGELIER